jgi:hypothetical protein
MALEIIKSNFEQLINDKNNSVIALSGKWGTGKSHLWNRFKEESTEKSIKNSLYVSLFGVKDIAQLKVKIIQSAAGDSNTSNIVKELGKTAWMEAKKYLKTIHKGFDALDDIALLAVPLMLRNRFIVIDDIERKHKNLDIEEILGFIDEFTQNYNTRFLLILNIDQLSTDKENWEKFREKIIDHELSLEITPSEAFEIAVQKISSQYALAIKKSVEICKVNNIRVIYKIIRTVNRFIEHRNDLTTEVLDRIIPSTVLLSALHFKGLVNGPSVQFVLEFNTLPYMMLNHNKKQEEETEETKKYKQWSFLLNELKINSCDEYEKMVVAHLRSGLFTMSDVNLIIDRYINEKDVELAKTHAQEFFDKDIWHPELTEAELLEEAKKLSNEIHLLDCYTVTAIFNTVKDYTGGQDIADQMIAIWLDHFNNKDHSEFEGKYELNLFKQELHPDIEKIFQDLRTRLNSPVSLFEVASQISHHSGWGDKETNAMKNSSPTQYIETITNLIGNDLKILLLTNIDMYLNKQTYLAHFGPGMDNFVEACRTIYNQDPNSRISKLIKLVFKDSKIEAKLEILAPTTSITS